MSIAPAVVFSLLIVGTILLIRNARPLLACWRGLEPESTPWGGRTAAAAFLLFALSLAGPSLAGEPSPSVILLSRLGFALALLWLLARSGGEEERGIFAVSFAAVRAGFSGYWLAMPGIVAAALLGHGLAAWIGDGPVAPQDAIRLFQSRTAMADRLALLLLAAVVGPVAEELFFRGALQSAVSRVSGPRRAILVCGLLFALIHLDPVRFLPLAVLGCALGMLREATGGLLAPVVAHALHNSLMLWLLDASGGGL